MPKAQKTTKKDTRKLLAKLEAADVQQIATAHRLLQEEQNRLAIFTEGVRVINRIMQEKYKLPEVYDLDTNTGNVYEREDGR